MATVKKTTRKLSGPSKDRFFDRFYAADGDLDPTTAERLSKRSKDVFTSVRVRKCEWPLSRDLRRAQEQPAPTPASRKPATPKPPKAATPKTTAPPAAATPPTSDKPATQAAFDPFVFGLVPIFKREGADGLRAKLDTISETENLRSMAKNQQIVLPREIRRGEVDAQSVRDAILQAVEQRVTDRKAQL